MLVPAEVFKVSEACEACDNENSRYALGSVKLEREGGQCRAIATNAKILTVYEWNDESARKDFPEPDVAAKCDMMIAKSHWQKLGRAVDAVKFKKPVLRNGSISETDQCGVNVLLTNIEDDMVVATRKVMTTEGRFPHWRDVFETYNVIDGKGHDGEAVEVTLDADELAKILKTVLASDDTKRRVTLRVPLSPFGGVQLESKAHEITSKSVIMPLTMD